MRVPIGKSFPKLAPGNKALTLILRVSRPDQQPLFMRNLGFAPNSGVSELYSYSSQIDPFMLPDSTVAVQDTLQEQRPHAQEDV